MRRAIVTYFHNGLVWSGIHGESTDALLVVDGIVTAIGQEAAVRAAAMTDIEHVDLDGGFLAPAFGDGHAHPLLGGLESEGPRVRECGSVEEIIDAVRRYAEEHPDHEWIVGSSYVSALAEGGIFDAHWLDRAVADRPVVLRAWDYHTVWCNSRALQLAGITAESPEPALGEIVRRADGQPIGTLREWGAVDLVSAVATPYGTDARLRALDRAAKYYLSRGVTWVQDAWVEPDDVEFYIEAAKRDVLRLRINLALFADPRRFPEQLPEMVDARARVEAVGNAFLSAGTVKFFSDGVIENETGALLEPYCSGLHGHGMRVWEGDSLAEAVRAVDAEGFQIHTHAIGDAAVHQALDAIEHAIAVNGERDRRPVIAHAQLIAEDDLPRFAQLDVTATMQPLWAQLDALMKVLTIPRLGQGRADQQYRIATLLSSGARVAFGSDWPVSSGAPLDGIAIAISRQPSEGDPGESWIPAEIISVEQALEAYTQGVAHQAFADLSPIPWGQIRPGMSADLVWLARDPRALSARQLAADAVRATYVAGIRNPQDHHVT